MPPKGHFVLAVIDGVLQWEPVITFEDDPPAALLTSQTPATIGENEPPEPASGSEVAYFDAQSREWKRAVFGPPTFCGPASADGKDGGDPSDDAQSDGSWRDRPPLLSLFLIGALWLSALCSPLVAAEPRPNLYRVSSAAVHDGDTLTCDIHLGFDVVLSRQSVRLAGFDAWEITRARRTVGEITDEEIAKGKVARDALLRYIGAGTPYLVPEGRGRDAYGRILARLMVQNQSGLHDVAEHMRASGHDRTYVPSYTPPPKVSTK